MDEVSRKGLDGEVGSIAADAGALPLIRSKALKVRGDDVGSGGQFPGYRDGVLIAVAVCYRGGVLVPVGETVPITSQPPGQRAGCAWRGPIARAVARGWLDRRPARRVASRGFAPPSPP